ncbi:hypothetical protein ES703_08588 [subsurface metagenome]
MSKHREIKKTVCTFDSSECDELSRGWCDRALLCKVYRS